MTMDKQIVWVRDGNEGFVLARIHELMGEEADVVPLDNKHPRRLASFEDIFPAGDPDKNVDDNCEYNVRQTCESMMGEKADVVPLDNKHPRRLASFEDIFPAGDPDKNVDDNCEYTVRYVSPDERRGRCGASGQQAPSAARLIRGHIPRWRPGQECR
ncbi:hypothetical protein NE865_01495 [Phthorimaea operculella]|nr:hypothetical protein NE865_01495 [Phthorimaea operculella]